MKTGIELIAEERQRQIDQEGWTFEHDDKHTDGSLANAAACYAVDKNEIAKDEVFLLIWPTSWDCEWYKPSPENRIKELKKAGALIAAEIDRLQRINS